MIHEWTPNQRNRITFTLVDSDNTEVTGLGTAFTLEVSQNGGAFGVGAGTKAEISDGWYSYLATAAEADTPGPVSVRVTGTGIVQQNLVYYVPTQAVAQQVEALDGTTLTIRRGDSLGVSITGLGDISGRSKLWFTVKSSTGEADSAALIQIEETAGLLYINGAAAGTAANGSITVTDESAGDLTIALDEMETAKLSPSGSLSYDIQILDSGDITTLTDAEANVTADVTRATS